MSAGKKGTAGQTARSSVGRPLSLEKQRKGTAPTPQQCYFSGALPSTLPALLGDLGSLSPVAGGLDSKTKSEFNNAHAAEPDMPRLRVWCR